MPSNPDQLSLDPRTTALVLIDVQGGVLAMPLAPHGAAHIVGRTADLGRRFAAAGATVVVVNVAFSAGFSDRLSQPVDAATPMPSAGLPAGWADLAPDIQALPADIVVTKRQWGAFHGTELDLQLRRRGISTVVLGGIATNFGVESTAREAWQHNYAVVVAEDACTSVSDEHHRFSMEKIMPRIARVRSTAQVMAALGAA